MFDTADMVYPFLTIAALPLLEIRLSLSRAKGTPFIQRETFNADGGIKALQGTKCLGGLKSIKSNAEIKRVVRLALIGGVVIIRLFTGAGIKYFGPNFVHQRSHAIPASQPA